MSHTVELDLPLHVVHQPGAGRPLVFLHGFGANLYTWHAWAPMLAAYDRYLVDLKGHGRAPAPDDGRYAPADQAALVHEMILRLDLRDVTLVGHSMGGGIALLTALRLLDGGAPHLRGLVLVASAAYPQRLPPFISIARRGVLARAGFALLPKRLLMRAVLRAIVHDPASVKDEQVEAYAAPYRDAAHRRALLATARQLIPDDLGAWTARFPEIDVPSLLLWGREDRVVPLSVGEALARALPHARLEVLDACGHMPPEEMPEASLAPVLRFLGSQDGG